MTERRNMNMNDDYTDLGYDDGVLVAEAMIVLSEMARERGVATVAELGDLPPLDPETKARYLARAKKRAEEAERHAS
jgi:hypothetical protein